MFSGAGKRKSRTDKQGEDESRLRGKARVRRERQHAISVGEEQR
jgi:hypothetical protein